MYLEFLYIIADYFSVLKKRILFFEWGLPIIIGIASAIVAYIYDSSILYIVISDVVPTIATLLGFTLAALTLVLTGNSKIDETKQYMTDKEISGQKISLYRFIVISLSYLILIESILCIAFYIASLFPYVTSEILCLVANGIVIILVLNVLFATIRSITDLYFIITKQEKPFV